MKTWPVVSGLVALAMILSACAPAATPTPAPAPTKAAAPTPTMVAVSTPTAATPTPTLPKPAAPTPTPPTEKPVYGGILRGDSPYDLGAHDPHYKHPGLPQAFVLGALYATIVRQDPIGWTDIVPDLATKWEIVEGGKAYVFTVRSGAKFADGSPITAEDVAYSIHRMITLPNALVSPRTTNVRVFAQKAEVLAPDKVKITLKSPAASFLEALASGFQGIAPKRILEKTDDPAKPRRDLTMEEWIASASGPFMPKAHTWDAMVKMVKNPNYYEKGLPYLDGKEMFIMPDRSTRLAALRTGKIDITSVFPPPTPSIVRELKRDLGDKIVVQFSFPPIPYLVFVNYNEKWGPWGDKRLRKAIHLALDRQEMIDLNTEKEGRIAPWYHSAWDWILPYEDYLKMPGLNPATKAQDIAEAKRIVAEVTGGKGIKDADLMCRPEDIYCELAQVAQVQLRKVGIETKLRVEEPKAGLEKLTRYELGLCTNRIAAGFDDPDAYNAMFYAPGAQYNLVKWETPKFVELYEKQKTVVDKKERGKLLKDMVMELAEELPWLPLVQPPDYQVWHSYVKGWSKPPRANPNQSHAYVWIQK